MPQTVQPPTQGTPQATPTVSTPITSAAPQETPKEVSAQDLIKRSSVVQTPAETPNEFPKVNISIDDVKDPVARQLLEKKLQEANAGISKTFGEIGAEKQKYLKEAESLRKQLESATNQAWTPQRVQELLNRQDFVQAAQTLQATSAPQAWQGSQEEWSNLNQTEKAQFQQAIQRTSVLEQQMGQMLQTQVDSALKTKYPDYNPQEVDEFMRKAQANQLTQEEIREAVHLAKNAHRYIKQAYGFAMEDKTVNLQEKLNGTTQMGLNVTPSNPPPEKKAGERSGTHFSRVAWENLQRLKSMMPQK